MKSLTFSLACLSLAGCAAVGPDYKAPVMLTPAAIGSWHGGASELQAHALEANAAQAFARFDDAVLARLQQQALAANHDIQSAASNFAQSRAQRSMTASSAGPQLQASGAARRQQQSEVGSATRMVGIIAPANAKSLSGALADPFTVYQAGFDATWELDLWGRVRRSVEAAEANIVETQAALRQVQLGVAIEVARTYYEMRVAQRQRLIVQADIQAGTELLELAAARRAGGLSTDLDVERETAQLATLRAGLPVLLEQEARAMNQLTLLTGTLPGALQAELAASKVDMDGPFGNTPSLALGIASDIVARRPDIQMAEARLHAATAGIGIAKADLYPRITLGASFGSEALSAGHFGEWGSRQWSLGPSLSLPLFDQGRRRATVELRELQQQQAAIAYQHTVLKAWTEVDNALSAYAAEQQRRSQWQQRESSNANAVALAAARYQQGLTDAIPLIDARRALLKARRDRLQSEAELTLRLLSICKAIAVTPTV